MHVSVLSVLANEVCCGCPPLAGFLPACSSRRPDASAAAAAAQLDIASRTAGQLSRLAQLTGAKGTGMLCTWRYPSLHVMQLLLAYMCRRSQRLGRTNPPACPCAQPGGTGCAPDSQKCRGSPEVCKESFQQKAIASIPRTESLPSCNPSGSQTAHHHTARCHYDGGAGSLAAWLLD
jgi:hypothetical protein